MILVCEPCGARLESGTVPMDEPAPQCAGCGLPLVSAPPELPAVTPTELLDASEDALTYGGVERTAGRRVLVRVAKEKLPVEGLSRALERAARLSRISHDNLLPVRSLGAAEGRWYVVSDFAHGGNLGELARRAGKLPAAAASRFLRDALAGLTHLHERRIAHGGLRASCLFLSRAGSLRLGGFALADELDARSVKADLFALGCVFARLLANLDSGDGSAAVLRHMAGVFEVEPGLPSALERAVERLLGRDPAGPFASAAAAAEMLEAAVAPFSEELCADLLADPPGTAARAARSLAEGHVARARELQARSPLSAGLFAYRALALCRDDAGVAEVFREICAEHLLDFSDLRSAERDEIEAELAADGDDASAWLRLGRLYAARGNPYRAVVCWKRYLRRCPGDLHVLAEVTSLTSPEELGSMALRGAAQAASHTASAATTRPTTQLDLLAPPLFAHVTTDLERLAVAALGARAAMTAAGARTSPADELASKEASTNGDGVGPAPPPPSAAPGPTGTSTDASEPSCLLLGLTETAATMPAFAPPPGAQQPRPTDSTLAALAALAADDAAGGVASTTLRDPAVADGLSRQGTLPFLLRPAALASGAPSASPTTTRTLLRPSNRPGKRAAAVCALLLVAGIVWHWYRRAPTGANGPEAMAARVVLPPPRPAQANPASGPFGAAYGDHFAPVPPGEPPSEPSPAPAPILDLERRQPPEPYFETRLARLELQAAEQHYLARRYGEAVATLDHLLRTYPQTLWFGFEAVLLRAQAQAALGRRREAAGDYRKVLAVSRADEEIHRRAKSGLLAVLRGEERDAGTAPPPATPPPAK